jgi:hypothetical protein
MAREKASGSAAPVEHVAEIGAARAGTMPVLPATASPAPAVNAGEERREARHTARDRELERLRKIEANYEKDRAEIAREKTPALARSESHEVGHAEENFNGKSLSKREIARMTKDFQEEVVHSSQIKST